MKNSKKRSIVGLGKYKSITFFISVFVVLILGLLGLNLYISNELQKKSREINIAANQASLVQEMSKSIYIIISQYQKVLPYDKEGLALSHAMTSFELRLRAFLGHINAHVSPLELPKKMLDRRGVEVLIQAEKIWFGYKNNISPLLSNQNNKQEAFLNALTYTNQYNQELTDLMNDLANIIQENSESDAFILRVIQIVGIVLAVFSFIFIIFYFLRFLRKSDFALELAQEETSGILRTVKEGLFLLDDRLFIGNQLSTEMSTIFEDKNIAGSKFSTLLKNIVPDEEVVTVLDFVKLLFDPNVVEDLISTLNPLSNIKVGFIDSNGERVEKYLDFSFHRVISNQEIENILVSVRDMTGENLLRQALEDTKAESNSRMVVLDEFLRADPITVDRFLLNVRKSLSHINISLKETSTNKQHFILKLEKIFIDIHRIKGESSTIGFSYFAEKAHEFESELESLRKINNIQGMDFLPLTIKLDGLLKAAENIENVANNIIRRGITKSAVQKNEDVIRLMRDEWKHLSTLVNTMSEQYQKPVDLVLTGFAESDLTPQYKNLINNISIQMIKNALVHGIEGSDERVINHKAVKGRIDLRLSALSNGYLELVMRDDGRGFDIDAIKEKLLSNQLISITEAKTWTSDRFVHKAFSTGFSTAKTVDMNSGRGVGLNVIKDTITEVGGKLSIRQATGQYCQLSIVFPPKAA